MTSGQMVTTTTVGHEGAFREVSSSNLTRTHLLLTSLHRYEVPSYLQVKYTLKRLTDSSTVSS